jgi:hypothetical protein
MDSRLLISIIYADTHLVQIQIAATNGYFAGEVTTYLDHCELSAASELLKGFPVGADDERYLQFGENTSLTFSTIDAVGHTKVLVQMTGDTPLYDLTERAEFILRVSPAAIDEFVRQLSQMRIEVGQTATLRGEHSFST